MNSLSFKTYKCVIIVTCVALLCLTGGCKSSQKSGKQKHQPIEAVKVEAVKVPKLKGDQKRIVEEALTWLGTPYRYAGSEKGKGTDCSGMVLKVYEDIAGIKLPRNSKMQADNCKKIKSKDVKPGDLAFFATGKDRNTISHVGIMIDEVQFIHASSKKGVVISDVTTDYYQRTLIMYGRVL